MFHRNTISKRMDMDPFVKPADIARYISDSSAARSAYEDLRQLLRQDLVNVYLPAGWIAAGRRDFNVWLNDSMLGFGRSRRVTLEEWCAAWFSAHEAPREKSLIGKARNITT